MRPSIKFKVLSLKLWLVLHTLRELLKFVDERLAKDATEAGDQREKEQKLALQLQFARTLLNDKPEDAVRHNEEQFIRQAVAAFPYKQSVR